MIDPLIAFVLVGATVAIAYGVATFPRKVRELREATTSNVAAEAEYIAKARAELAATGWTPDHESLYQAEIAASKRGDLLGAARYAEQQESLCGR